MLIFLVNFFVWYADASQSELSNSTHYISNVWACRSSLEDIRMIQNSIIKLTSGALPPINNFIGARFNNLKLNGKSS